MPIYYIILRFDLLLRVIQKNITIVIFWQFFGIFLVIYDTTNCLFKTDYIEKRLLRLNL